MFSFAASENQLGWSFNRSRTTLLLTSTASKKFPESAASALDSEKTFETVDAAAYAFSYAYAEVDANADTYADADAYIDTDARTSCIPILLGCSMNAFIVSDTVGQTLFLITVIISSIRFRFASQSSSQGLAPNALTSVTPAFSIQYSFWKIASS